MCAIVSQTSVFNCQIARTHSKQKHLLNSHYSSHIITRPPFKHLDLGRFRLVHALKLEQRAIFVPFIVT